VLSCVNSDFVRSYVVKKAPAVAGELVWSIRAACRILT
jgi:hypothetical protein